MRGMYVGCLIRVALNGPIGPAIAVKTLSNHFVIGRDYPARGQA